MRVCQFRHDGNYNSAAGRSPPIRKNCWTILSWRVNRFKCGRGKMKGAQRGHLMYFEQFFLGCLAHASYMLGSEGEAIVVDPQRDVDLYLKAAEEQGLKIRHVFETHLHADFVSGHRELAERTGATIYMGAQAGARFPHIDIQDGFELR